MSRLERIWQLLPANVRTYIWRLVDRLEPSAPHCPWPPEDCARRANELIEVVAELEELQDKSNRHIQRVRQLEADRDADIEKMGKLLSEVQFAMQTVKALNGFYTDLATRRREDISERVLGPCDEVNDAP